jgi:hypothetical protein
VPVAHRDASAVGADGVAGFPLPGMHATRVAAML